MKDNRIDLLAYRCTYWEGKLYCLTKDFNLLFSIDPQDGTIELIDVIPEIDVLSDRTGGAINAWNGKLIITPCRIKKIWIYDLATKHWDSINVEECGHCGTGLFNQTYIYEDSIFLIGGNYPAILCVDLKSNSCHYIKAPYEEIISRHPDVNYNYFHPDGVRIKNTLYLASCLDNFVLKFDLETQEHHWIEVGNKNNVYSAITWDGENFWLSPRLNGGIVKWDGAEMIQLISLPEKLKQTVPIYSWGACYDGSQVVFPHDTCPKSIILDIHNNTFQLHEQQYPLYTRLYNGMVVSQTTDGDLSVRTEDSSNKIFHISVEADQLRQFYEERNIQIYKDQTLYTEIPNNPMLSLDGFLAFTSSRSQNKPKSNGQVGKAIWDNIR